MTLHLPDPASAREAMLRAITTPIEAGTLLVYPTVIGVRSAEDGGVYVSMTVRELAE